MLQSNVRIVAESSKCQPCQTRDERPMQAGRQGSSRPCRCRFFPANFQQQIKHGSAGAQQEGCFGKSTDFDKETPHNGDRSDDGPPEAGAFLSSGGGFTEIPAEDARGCDRAVMFLKGERNTVRLACVGQRSS